MVTTAIVNLLKWDDGTLAAEFIGDNGLIMDTVRLVDNLAEPRC
ncbi:hypothetical protein R3Q06_29345 [Rhodococcus erythropolis]|nr:hypothetical protein [Rhodococcus erythropolis]MDV6277601.1 hypothetical protein [Rhodococcus erythropolis]